MSKNLSYVSRKAMKWHSSACVVGLWAQGPLHWAHIKSCALNHIPVCHLKGGKSPKEQSQPPRLPS